jgi:MFS family permease
MRGSSHSAAFTPLAAAIVAIPSFGIDMSPAALGAIGTTLGVSVDCAGLTISMFMFGYTTTPSLCGPASDQIGLGLVVLGAVALPAAGSLGGAAATSLAILLACGSSRGRVPASATRWPWSSSPHLAGKPGELGTASVVPFNRNDSWHWYLP